MRMQKNLWASLGLLAALMLMGGTAQAAPITVIINATVTHDGTGVVGVSRFPQPGAEFHRETFRGPGWRLEQDRPRRVDQLIGEDRDSRRQWMGVSKDAWGRAALVTT